MSLTVNQPELFRQIQILAQSALNNSLKPALNRAGQALSREAGLWPAFGLGLHFCAMNLGLAIIVVGRGTVAPDRAGFLIHFLAVPLAGLALSLALRRGGRLWRAWPFLLAGGVLVGLAWLFSLSQGQLGGRFYFLPVVAVMTLNWPAGLWLFFQTRPERAGLTLGLAMASGEMIWVLLVPLLSAAFAGPPSAGQTLYLCKTFGFLPALAGAGLAMVMYRLGRGGPAVDRPEAGPVRPSFSWLLAGGVCFFALFGLAWGSGLPRSVIPPAARENLHYFLLFGAPLTGWLLDRERPGRRGGLALVLPALVLAALAVPLSNLLTGAFSPAAFTLMNVVRESFLLTLFIGAARLGGSRLPLWGSLAYSLYLMQFAGAAAGRLLYAHWGAGALIAGEAGLVLALALSLWRFWQVLGREPLPTAASVDGQTTEPEDRGLDEAAKAALFAAAFRLTPRETEILGGLLDGLDLAALAERLGVSQRTVKFHLTGLLKKAGRPNRRSLLAYYAVWLPEGPTESK